MNFTTSHTYYHWISYLQKLNSIHQSVYSNTIHPKQPSRSFILLDFNFIFLLCFVAFILSLQNFFFQRSDLSGHTTKIKHFHIHLQNYPRTFKPTLSRSHSQLTPVGNGARTSTSWFVATWRLRRDAWWIFTQIDNRGIEQLFCTPFTIRFSLVLVFQVVFNLEILVLLDVF